MSQAKVLNRSALFGAAIALTALGFVTVPAPAHAVPNIPLAPACEKWQWPGGNFHVNYLGMSVAIATSQDRVVGTPAMPGTNNTVTGTPSGGMSGTSIDFTIDWNPGPGNTPYSHHFTGKINDDGFASGIVKQSGGREDNWSSPDKFFCSVQAAPPPPPPPPPPKPCPPGSVKPEVIEPEKCAPPTNTVRMEIGGGALQRTVTVTNNGPLGGTCAYDAKATSGLFAPGLNRQINVGPNGSASIDVPAPPLGSTYHVTLKCTGEYDGKQVQFGQAEQDVSSF